MKKIITSCLSLLLCLMAPLQSLAATSTNSNTATVEVGITFIEETVITDKEEIEEIKEVDDVEDVTTEDELTVSDSSKQSTTQKSETLPKTGERASFSFVLMGSLIFLIGIVLFRKLKSRE